MTLRSSIDGRFLARIVEQNANVFVLDFGDRRVIDDATQRIHRGFTVFRGGQLIRAAPREQDLLVLLADYYAAEGLLVSLEEPLWPGRERSLEDMLADRSEARLQELSLDSVPRLPNFDEETQDLPTDVWGRDEEAAVKALIGDARDRAVRATWAPPVPLDALVPIEPHDDLDAPTVEVTRSGRPVDAGAPTLVDGEDDHTDVVPRLGGDDADPGDQA